MQQSQNDIERDVVINDKVDHVFYQAILDHINRAAFASYPKYALDENKLHFIKKETDIKNTDPESKNLILKKLVAGKKRDGSKINDQDRKLFLQIIRQSRDVVQEKYGAKFTVILWDLIKDNDELILENEYNLKYVTQALKDLNINYVLISDILSDYKNNPEQYTIKGDGHPSPLTHKKIAQYLAKNIGG